MKALLIICIFANVCFGAIEITSTSSGGGVNPTNIIEAVAQNGVLAMTNGVAFFSDESGSIVATCSIALTNFVAGATNVFDLAKANATITDRATFYPDSARYDTYQALFDENVSTDNPSGIEGKLLVNPIIGQSQDFRFKFAFKNKAQAINTGFFIGIHNPTSGFNEGKLITLPSGVTYGNFDIDLKVISNEDNIGDTAGFILRAKSTVTDNNLVLELINMTRINPLAICKSCE